MHKFNPRTNGEEQLELEVHSLRSLLNETEYKNAEDLFRGGVGLFCIQNMRFRMVWRPKDSNLGVCLPVMSLRFPEFKSLHRLLFRHSPPPLFAYSKCIWTRYFSTFCGQIYRVSTFLFIIAWNHNSNFNWRKKNNLKKKKKEERHSRRIIVWNFRWYCRFIESSKYLRAVKWQRDFGYR